MPGETFVRLSDGPANAMQETRWSRPWYWRTSFPGKSGSDRCESVEGIRAPWAKNPPKPLPADQASCKTYDQGGRLHAKSTPAFLAKLQYT